MPIPMKTLHIYIQTIITVFCTNLKVIGVAMQIIGYIQVVCWMIPAERQVLMMRKTLFKSILRQNIGWFDCYKSGELTNRLTE